MPTSATQQKSFSDSLFVIDWAGQMSAGQTGPKKVKKF